MSNFFFKTMAGAALLAYAALAQAQYMWIDAKGLKQYSDRPPPPSVPLKDILKAPKGQLSADNLPAAETAPPATAAAPAPKAAPSVADREADYVKRQKDKAEQDKKAGAEKEHADAVAENCDRARNAKRSLDSGARIGITDKNGERGFMDDAQRAAESAKVDKVLSGCPAR